MDDQNSEHPSFESIEDDEDYEPLAIGLLKAAIIKAGGILDLTPELLDKADNYDGFELARIPKGYRLRLILRDPPTPKAKA